MADRFSVIFDMDGVIFDSERAYINTFRDICGRDGIPFIEQACVECIGSNWDATKRIYEKWYGEDWDFPYYYNKVREEMGRLSFPLKPCVREIFDYLGSADIPCALASSTRRESVERMLDNAGLRECFSAIVCGDMVSRSKPAPDIFLAAGDALGAAPYECFVIEDSFNGVRAGHAAGMRTIMVPDILQPDDEIRSLAEAVLPDLGGVIEYFRKQARI